MADAINSIFGIFGALQPKPATLHYDGLEYKWRAFTFRPAEFKLEAGLLLALLAYLGFYFIGRTYNLTRAKAAMAPYDPILKSNFASARPLIHSGPSQHLAYASGRRNVLSLHGTLVLFPYHDIAGMITKVVQSIIEPNADLSENLVWGLTLGRGEYGLQGESVGVWAVINKQDLRAVKDSRWDLSFPRTQENVAVPFTHSLFTEHSDINDVLLKTVNVGITDLLQNKTAASVLKYFLITDQPVKRPAKGALPSKFRTREIILSVRKPRNKLETDAVKAWLQVALNVADLLAKPNVIKPEVTRKLVTTRKTVEEELGQAYAKEQAEDQPAEMTPEEKRLAKKKAERANMSEKEIKRLEELEKKREMRKLAKKQGYKQQ